MTLEWQIALTIGQIYIYEFRQCSTCLIKFEYILKGVHKYFDSIKHIMSYTQHV